MAINKITNEQRELMKRKSAQSLPDVPSSRGWTPKQFKDSITKPLFDNENSLFSHINRIVDEIDQKKLDVDNYYIVYIDGGARDSVVLNAITHKTNNPSINCIYKTIISTPGGKTDAIIIVGNTSIYSATLITHTDIYTYEYKDTQLTLTSTNIAKISTSEMNVLTKITAPTPKEAKDVVIKEYLDSIIETINLQLNHLEANKVNKNEIIKINDIATINGKSLTQGGNLTINDLGIYSIDDIELKSILN